MKYCSKCGSANADEAAFCSSCGTPLERAHSAPTPPAPPAYEPPTPTEPAAGEPLGSATGQPNGGYAAQPQGTYTTDPNAGYSQSYNNPYAAAPAAPEKNNSTLWLILNIVAVVVCCPGFLFSGIGIVFAALGMGSYNKGDYADAKAKNKVSMIMFIIGAAVGLIGYIGWTITMLAASSEFLG